MTPDGQALLEAAEKNPGDRLATLALADHLEELGAAPVSVRALTVDGPTVLVFGYPEGMTEEQRHCLYQQADMVCKFLAGGTGYPVQFVVMPSSVTIRQIKVQAKTAET